jgi:hypothetical protein
MCKITSTFIIISITAFFFTCSSTVTDNAGNDKDEVTYKGATVTQSVFDLPDCNNNTEGQLFYTLDTEEFHYCDGFSYTIIDLTGPEGPTGEQGSNGISINWLGSLPSAPISPNLNDAYYNTTDGIAYVWDGDTWEKLSQDGADGSDSMPYVLYTTPFNTEKGILETSNVKVVFNKTVDTSTVVLDTTFSVSDSQGESIAGTISWDSGSRILTFNPTEIFPNKEKIYINMSQDISDSDGNLIGYSHAFYFTTIGWGIHEIIQGDEGSAHSPQIAFDNFGNAIAVWIQNSNSTRDSIRANRYVAGIGWGTAQQIENNSGDAKTPRIAVDSSGNAIVIWCQSNGAKDLLWANYYAAGIGWDPFAAELIQSDLEGNASNPEITIDNSGNAFAVWYQTHGNPNKVWANRYRVSFGWQTAEYIENVIKSEGESIPHIDTDSTGNAIAVWRSYDGTKNNIRANRFVVGEGWETAEFIENNDSSATEPRIVFDSNDNAIAVWRSIDGKIWANRYIGGEIGIGWGTPEIIHVGTGPADFDITIDSSNNAIMVWSQENGTDIWANRFEVVAGWGTAELIDNVDGGDPSAGMPKIAVDNSGNAIAIWSHNDGLKANIWANRYLVGLGWRTPVLIEDLNFATGLDPKIAFDSNDRAIAIWRESNGDGRWIFTRWFE